MGFIYKRFKKIMDITKDMSEEVSFLEGLETLKKCPKLKFDESVDISIKLGIDVKKSDQQVRGSVILPNGTGKKVIVLALVKQDKVDEAISAGADYAGSDEYIEKIKQGWFDFDTIVVTPDMMRDISKLGKILGPKGLMPSPKLGTITDNIENIVKQIKKGRIDFKVDKAGVVNNIIGKLSFSSEALYDNAKELIKAIQRARPATCKGSYMQNFFISSTMGPGIKINLSNFFS